jgi:hypothetical protein
MGPTVVEVGSDFGFWVESPTWHFCGNPSQQKGGKGRRKKKSGVVAPSMGLGACVLLGPRAPCCCPCFLRSPFIPQGPAFGGTPLALPWLVQWVVCWPEVVDDGPWSIFFVSPPLLATPCSRRCLPLHPHSLFHPLPLLTPHVSSLVPWIGAFPVDDCVVAAGAVTMGRWQSGIAVSDALIALHEQVKLRNAHKYIIFSLKKIDAKNFDWSIDFTAEPCADMSQNEVR